MTWLWFVAMAALLPLMTGKARLRVWCALVGASAASWIFPHIAAHIAIDILAGALVLKRPKGLAQKIIGFLFVAMILFSTGFLVSPQFNPDTLQTAMIVMGWMQWAVLLSWGMYDLARNRRSRPSPAGSVSPVDAGRIR